MTIFKKISLALLTQFFIAALAYSANTSKTMLGTEQLPINSLMSAEANIEQSNVIATIKNAEDYIRKYGKEKAIIEFKKNSTEIFMGDYKGNFYLSPLHPELIGTNQFNYKDASGALPVQEEIEKAKAGGGWLKARWRKNPSTGKFQCRKIYIFPMPGNYFIGSWYNYSPNTQGICLI